MLKNTRRCSIISQCARRNIPSDCSEAYKLGHGNACDDGGKIVM